MENEVVAAAPQASQEVQATTQPGITAGAPQQHQGASTSWRVRPTEMGSSGTTPISTKGELQMADQFIRDHFTLFLWIPTEQVGIVIGKKGAKIQYIQGATKTRVVIAAQPGEDWESAWFQVMVKGPPSGCYQAFKMISALVDEVDECVASFPIPRPKHALVIGKNGTTIRTISADTSVRIYVPGKKEEAATNDIQLEGDVPNVMKAVASIITSVYGGIINRMSTPAQQQQQAAASKAPEENQEASGEAEAEGVEKDDVASGVGKKEGEEVVVVVGEGASAGTKVAKAVNNKQQAGAASVEGAGDDEKVERTIVVTLSKLRLLVAGKKNSALIVVGKATGTKIIKEPKAKQAPSTDAAPAKEEAEGAVEGGEEAPRSSEEVVVVEGEEEVAEVVVDKPDINDEEEEEEEEEGGEEEEGEEEAEPAAKEDGEEEGVAAAEEEAEDEEAGEAAPSSDVVQEETGGAASAAEGGDSEPPVTTSRPDPLIKIFIKGPDMTAVDAAVEALMAVADGKAVKDLIPELRNRFGKANPPPGQSSNHAGSGNNKGAATGGGPNNRQQHGRGGGKGGRQGGAAQGRKVGGGRGAVQVPRRGIQVVSAKTT